jgi:hypothetical protein
LEPFEKATLLVQKQENVSAILTIPVTLGLKHHLGKISCDCNNSFVDALESSTDARLSKNEAEEAYIVAALLDPRFKLR